MAGTMAGLAASVWLCGQGEKILGKTDPGCIVMDEITAIPVCFGAFLVAHYLKHGAMPTIPMLFSRSGWLVVGTVFACFRFFDIAKPWPVRQSQVLPGGWGVTVDDVLAAFYTAAAAYLILRLCGRHELA
jgi:phosphatidylglycerophosphatase A